jgi:hypothetical protein
MSSKKRRQNSIDRATRLGIIITFFGGLAYIFKGAFKIWFNTFSQIAYTKNIFNIDYLLAIVIFTIVIAIAGYIIRYIYFELKTYQYYSSENDQQSALAKADNSFEEIFIILKYCTYLVLGILIITTIINLVNEPSLFRYIVVGAVSAVILLILKLLVYRSKLGNMLKSAEQLGNKLSPKIKYFGVIFYIILFVLVSGISLTIVSLNNNNQFVKVELKEKPSVLLSIELQNFHNPEIQLNIFRESGAPAHIKISEKELQYSLVEVLEKNKNMLHDKEIDKNKKNLSLKEIDKFHINESKYFHKYVLDLNKYIHDGKNALEILVFSDNSLNEKTVHIVVSIDKEGNEIKIHKKKFEIKL